MSPHSLQRPSPSGSERRVVQQLDTPPTNRAVAAAGAPAPGATLPGPSRRITVEPLTVPQPAPRIPMPAPPEVQPDERPEPVGVPTARR